MKKKAAFLFAALVLVLSGCGPKVNDHVVDYELDIPDGFVETELAGADACWYRPSDNSNINLLIVKKAAAADVAYKAVTADILRETVAESLKEAYGAEPAITDRSFSKDSVCGLDAYQYCYDVAINGQSTTQLVVSINADRTYTFTYTTSDEETLALFQESARNIQLVIE